MTALTRTEFKKAAKKPPESRLPTLKELGEMLTELHERQAELQELAKQPLSESERCDVDTILERFDYIQKSVSLSIKQYGQDLKHLKNFKDMGF